MIDNSNDILHLEKPSQRNLHAPVKEIGELTSQIALKILESDNENIAEDIILLLEESREKGRDKIVNVSQTQRNFDIIIKQNNRSIQIVLKNKFTSAEFDLSSLFPNNWYKFIPSEVDCYFNHSFTVGVNITQLELRGFILGVLHEIGHTYQYSQSRPLMFLKMGFVALAYSKVGIAVQKLLQNFKYEVEEDILLDAEKSSYKERNAWAFALVQARKLEKLGFNVLSNFEGVGEISEYIGRNLATYDEYLFYDMLDTFGDITPENVHLLQKALSERPLFNKKTKNIYQLHI